LRELEDLIELLGVEPTLKLIEAYGGTRVDVPKHMRKKHPLRTVLGDSGFALLFQYFGGARIIVPIARAWRINIYIGLGLTNAEIARRAGCTENTVYAYRRAGTTPDGQLAFSFEEHLC
jgi:hypothetical protein